LMNRKEIAFIGQGVRAQYAGRLKDVLDEESPSMQLDYKGSTQFVPVQPGCWFISCASHFKSQRLDPILSPDGRVLSPQAALFFPYTSSFVLTHLWYENNLSDLPSRLHVVDHGYEPRKNYLCLAAIAAMSNFYLVLKHVMFSPTWSLRWLRYTGTWDSYHPWYKRAPMYMRVLTNGSKFLRAARQYVTTYQHALRSKEVKV